MAITAMIRFDIMIASVLMNLFFSLIGYLYSGVDSISGFHQDTQKMTMMIVNNDRFPHRIHFENYVNKFKNS